MVNQSEPSVAFNSKLGPESVATFACEDAEKERLLTRAKIDYRVLQDAPEAYRMDRELVLAAVNCCWKAFQLAHCSFRNDRDVVLAAVGQHWHALHNAALIFRDDRDVIWTALNSRGGSTSWEALSLATLRLRCDHELVLKAIEKGGYQRVMMSVADPSMRGNRDLMLAAVQRGGRSLKYADPAMRGDKEIVLAAVNNTGSALQFADETLKADREVVLAAVTRDGYSIRYMNEVFQYDEDIILAAVEQGVGVFKILHPSMKRNRKIVLAAVQLSSRCFAEADPSMREDPYILFEYCRGGGEVTGKEAAIISDKLLLDRPLCDRLVAQARQNPFALPGSRAPVISLDTLHSTDLGLGPQVCYRGYSMSGFEVAGAISMEDNLIALGCDIQRQIVENIKEDTPGPTPASVSARKPLLHLILPNGDAVDPLADALRPAIAWLGAGEGE